MQERILLITPTVIVVVLLAAVVQGARIDAREARACQMRGGVPVHTRTEVLCLKRELVNEGKP